MKTMTCRQLGGPCDLALRGDTADDVIQAQDQHLKEVTAAGDSEHRAARDAMKGRWRDAKSINGRDRGNGFRDCITENFPNLTLLEIPTRAWSGEDAAGASIVSGTRSMTSHRCAPTTTPRTAGRALSMRLSR